MMRDMSLKNIPSGVFCWVHERSECTCKTRKYALCTLHFGGRDL